MLWKVCQRNLSGADEIVARGLVGEIKDLSGGEIFLAIAECIRPGDSQFHMPVATGRGRRLRVVSEQVLRSKLAIDLVEHRLDLARLV